MADLLSSAWGIEGEIAELGSTQDQNFSVVAGGRRYLLKIANRQWTRRELELQGEAMRYLADRRIGVELPTSVAAAGGGDLVEADGHLVRLVTWVEGSMLADRGHLEPRTLAELGALAGRCQGALVEFRHEGLERDLQWEPRQAPRLLAELGPELEDGERRQMLVAGIAALDPFLEDQEASLPVQAVHCDVTDYNVVARRGADGLLRPTGLIDFGDVSESWRVTEAAHAAMAAVFHDLGDPLGGVLAVLRGFNAVSPLGEREAEAVWPLVLARAAVCALSSTHQAGLVEDSAHLARAVGEDWATLGAVLAVPRALAVAACRAACGFDPYPGSSRLLADLLAAKPEPILKELPSPRPLDLSMTSGLLDFGAWERPEDVREEIESVPGTPVGRWGEVRLPRVGRPGERGPQALHLGVDLFVAAGSAVQAPLAGIVERVEPRGLLLALEAGEGPTLLRLAGLDPGVEPGQEIEAGDRVGAVAATDSEAPHLHLQICAGEPLPGLVAAREHAAALAVCPDPSPLLGFDAAAPPIEAPAEAVARRGAVVASAQEHYYAEPPEIVRGWRHLLYDGEGRPYVDAVNNVALVGHSHPAIAAAAGRQLRLLNTNSRFLYGAMAAYAESLVALMPPGLDRVFFVNSGSEAVDLALRIARSHSGREDVIALEGAYHGWTSGTFELCTSPADRPDWRRHPSPRVHVVAQPDPYRGQFGAEAAGYVDSVRRACEAAAKRGGLAAFISEPLLGNQGGVAPPPGYLAGAYEAVRGAGGLCIADEVQVGFGRTGTDVWAFAHEGVVPDIVCVAKAAGNGYPVGAVICSEEVAEGIGAGGFFSSPAGSPLSCEVGRTVIEVLLDERLPENARRVGEVLRTGLERLAQEHELIGAVHGRGLYMGVDLVRDRETKQPADREAVAVCERARSLGVIVQPTGDRGNVLKVKPPLCLDAEGAEAIVAAIGRGLGDIA